MSWSELSGGTLVGVEEVGSRRGSVLGEATNAQGALEECRHLVTLDCYSVWRLDADGEEPDGIAGVDGVTRHPAMKRAVMISKDPEDNSQLCC